MDQTSLAEIQKWLSSGYGYGLIFLAMLIEGPVVTAAGAFASFLGYFNLWLIFILSVLGNLIPDVAYYLLGFFGRHKIIDKYGKYIGLSPERIEKFAALYNKHVGKTIFAVKMIPLIATPGLIVAGISRVPIKKFAFWSAIVTIPSSFGFLLLGYYFGAAYIKILAYAENGGYLLLGIAVVFVLISYGYKKIAKRISEKVEKI